MPIALAALPLVALILAMTVRAPRLRLPLPATVALPAAALLAYAAHLLAPIPGVTALELYARIIEGLLASLTPLAIVFGALLLFAALQRSGAMAVITTRLERATPDPVLRILLVAWAFSYLVEGLSGFGTPAALAAPILVGMGFPPVRAAAACLVMNTIPVVFGAVGTPIWFGLSQLDLSQPQLLTIAQDAAIVQTLCAPVAVAFALRLLLPWSAIRRRTVTTLVIVFATTGAALAASRIGVEFPSIIGGAVGIAACIIAARLTRPTNARDTSPPTLDDAPTPPLTLPRAVAPLAAAVALLAVTRIDALGIKALLTATSPAFSIDLPALGTLRLAPSGVITLERILGADVSWSMALLYVPFILPFVVCALLAAALQRMTLRDTAATFANSTRRLRAPAVALAGALVLVKLLMTGGDDAPVMQLGSALAAAVAAIHPDAWPAAATLLGALGSFFSGSATVSNLTFAPVQDAVARQLGLDPLRVLAMQSVGAALGNMVCIHNIVAVAAVLGLLERRPEPQPPPSADPASPASPTSPASSTPPASSAPPDAVSAILRLTAPPLAAVLAAAMLAAVLI